MENVIQETQVGPKLVLPANPYSLFRVRQLTVEVLEFSTPLSHETMTLGISLEEQSRAKAMNAQQRIEWAAREG